MSTQIINRWSLNPGDVLDLNPGDVYEIQNYSPANWNGNNSASVTIQCSASDNPATIKIPQNIYLSYVNIKNIIVSGQSEFTCATYSIIADSSTCQDLGGNSGHISFSKSWNLLSWYKADNTTEDFVAGNTASWFTGTSAYATGENGNAFNIDHTRSVIIPNNTIYDFGFNTPNDGKFAIEFYTKWTSGVGGNNLFAQSDGMGDAAWYLSQLVNPSDNNISIRNSTYTVYEKWNTDDLIHSMWYKIRIEYVNGWWFLYINDVFRMPILSNEFFVVPSTLPFIMQGVDDEGDISGLYDDVKIYNYIKDAVPSTWNLAAWYKGENTSNDELGGPPLILRPYSGYDPRYADGQVGRCFRIAHDEFGGYNELTQNYNVNTNILSVGVWAIDSYFQVTDSREPVDIFILADEPGGGGTCAYDYINATLHFDTNTLVIKDRASFNIIWQDLSYYYIDVDRWNYLQIRYNKGTWTVTLNGTEIPPTSNNNYGLIIDHEYTNYLFSNMETSGTIYADEIKFYTDRTPFVPTPTTSASSSFVTTRYGENKLINLVQYLPGSLRGTETETFLGVFENFLNNCFSGSNGYTLSATDLDISSVKTSASNVVYDQHSFDANVNNINGETESRKDAERIDFVMPSNFGATPQMISILEKIKRIQELQDASLVDIEFINQLANNLGYSIDIKKDEIIGNSFGNLSVLEQGILPADLNTIDNERYLRFVVENLPSFYKIKSTKNSIAALLFSFGLIGELSSYFTKTYSDIDPGDWFNDVENNLSTISDDSFPTPHFSINVNINRSINKVIFVNETIINAIESIRPIQTVFRGLHGIAYCELPTTYLFMMNRIGLYKMQQIQPGFPSDYFARPTFLTVDFHTDNPSEYVLGDLFYLFDDTTFSSGLFDGKTSFCKFTYTQIIGETRTPMGWAIQQAGPPMNGQYTQIFSHCDFEIKYEAGTGTLDEFTGNVTFDHEIYGSKTRTVTV